MWITGAMIQSGAFFQMLLLLELWRSAGQWAGYGGKSLKWTNSASE